MDATAFQQFIKDLTHVYEHLYDLVYLRSHPLIRLWFPDSPASGKELAWQFQHALLDALQELDPGAHVPPFSREWRRHRLLVLRYVDGLTPQAVADQLAISRRHFYREHEGAIEALAEILWQRYADHHHTADLSTPGDPDTSTAAISDRMQLMRLEAAQLIQIERRTTLAEVLHGVFTLLADKIAARGLLIDNTISVATPPVWGDSRLIRQLLLGVIGHMLTVAHDGTLSVRAELPTDPADNRLTLRIISQPDSALDNPQTSFAFLYELALLSAVTLTPLNAADGLIGFDLAMPLYTDRRIVLIADDNDDTLELFQRYLKPLDYEVVTVNASVQLLEAAKRIRPSVIILDLMMPDQDGWDLMQILQHQPETQAIPIIICSVLHQKELALSLGASAFLEKPVAENELADLLALLTA